MKYFISIFAFTIVYYFFGLAGIAMAIPPGYASPIFPAAGIAAGVLLASSYRLSIGVFFGSIFLNMTISYINIKTFHFFPTLMLSAGIALGSMAQAIFVKFLTEKVIGKNNPLVEIRSILLFYLLAGPASSIVSCSVGTLSLFLYGAIDISSVVNSCFYWWVGDTFGVIVFAPICLSLLSSPRKNWVNRRFYISIALLITFSVSLALFLVAQKWYNEKMQLSFKSRADLIFKQIEGSVLSDISILHSIERFYSSSIDVSRHEFSTFIDNILDSKKEIQALSWNPQIVRSEVSVLEKKAHSDGLSDFKIWPSDFKDEIVYPVLYISPLEGNRKALGYNIGSNDVRLKAVSAATILGVPVATEQIRLVQDKSSMAGILIFYPVYRGGTVPDSVFLRQKMIKGFATGAFVVRDLLLNTLGENQLFDLNLQVSDLRNDGTEDILLAGDNGDWKSPYNLHAEKIIKFAERQWKITLKPNAQYIPLESQFSVFYIFAFGLMMSGVIGAFMMHVTGTNIVFLNLVDERTQELKDTNTQLLRATNIKSQFLAHMSHEIRTPMNGIIGMSQMLLKRAVDSRTVEVVSNILSSAKDLLGIINDILDVSKVESDKITIEEIPFLFDDIIHSIEGLFREALMARGILLEIKIAGDVPKQLLGDPTRIKQVLINLVGNALKFTEKGRICLSAHTISQFEGKHRILFEVIDTGVGIPADKHQVLFHSFSQADSTVTRHYGGTGLGLYLCKQLVELMGGTIDVESKEGEGARFFFYLDLAEDKGHEIASNFSSTSSYIQTQDHFYPLNILFAEDVETNIKLGEMIFSYLGYEVTIARSGKEVIEAFDQRDFDLIFMDMQMPELSGVDASKNIREQKERKQPYIVALTANAYSEDRQRCLEAGMDDFLSKPFEVDKIVQIIQYVSKKNKLQPIHFTQDKAPSSSDNIYAHIDSQQVLELVSLNRKVFVELYQLFVSKFEPFLVELTAAIDEDNHSRFKAALHSFKGVCLNLGARKMAQILTENRFASPFQEYKKELVDEFQKTKHEMVTLLKIDEIE